MGHSFLLLNQILNIKQKCKTIITLLTKYFLIFNVTIFDKTTVCILIGFSPPFQTCPVVL